MPRYNAQGNMVSKEGYVCYLEKSGIASIILSEELVKSIKGRVEYEAARLKHYQTMWGDYQGVPKVPTDWNQLASFLVSDVEYLRILVHICMSRRDPLRVDISVVVDGMDRGEWLNLNGVAVSLKKDVNIIIIDKTDIYGSVYFDAIALADLENILIEVEYVDLLPSEYSEEQSMSAIDPIAVAALTEAVDFLFDQAGKLMEERRESRRKRGEDDDEKTITSETKLTTKEEVMSWQPKQVRLKDTPEEVRHCLTMIEQYRRNKRYTDATISQYGGYNLAPINVRNELLIQEDQIKEWTYKLKKVVEEAYGHNIVIVGLD